MWPEVAVVGWHGACRPLCQWSASGLRGGVSPRNTARNSRMADMIDRGGTAPTVAAGSPVAGHPDAWHRLTWLWHGLVIGTLAVPTLITLIDGEGDLRERLVTAAIATGLAGWHVLLVARHPQWWGARALPMAIYWV